MMALLGEWKAWLIAGILGAIAAVITGLAIFAKSQQHRADKLKQQRDQALATAANATTQRRVAAEAQRAAEAVETRAANEAAANPPDVEKRDDFEGGW